MTFIDMLFNRDMFPPPPVGAGRIHTIDDTEDEIPDQPHRFHEILWVLKEEGGNADTVRRRLPFAMPKAMLVADCEELAERGLVIIRRSGAHSAYYSLAQPDDCRVV